MTFELIEIFYQFQSPRPYAKADQSVFIFDQKSTHAVQVPGTTRVVPRKFVPGTNYFFSPLDEKLKKNMELFQVKIQTSFSPPLMSVMWRLQKADGVPVHLKRGQPDKILFGVTIGLMMVGIVSVFNLVYKLAVPKKQWATPSNATARLNLASDCNTWRLLVFFLAIFNARDNNARGNLTDIKVEFETHSFVLSCYFSQTTLKKYPYKYLCN